MINRHLIWPISIRYGFFCGISQIILLATILASGGSIYHPALALGWIITYVYIHRFIKSLRENEGEGYISFRHAYFCGLTLSFFAFLLYGLVLYLLGTLVFPEILTDARNELLRNAEAMERIFSSSSFFKADDLYEAYENITLGQFAYSESLSKFLGALFLSLVAALILRRKQPPIQHDQSNQLA
ncbi:MAG: DUF4199 domain-containing protein [Bacteroidota bacterium]